MPLDTTEFHEEIEERESAGERYAAEYRHGQKAAAARRAEFVSVIDDIDIWVANHSCKQADYGWTSGFMAGFTDAIVMQWYAANRLALEPRFTAYAVLAIDTETASIKGVGIFSEPDPTVSPWATVVLFQIDADDYETAQQRAWEQLGAYPWIAKAFPVVHEHRHSRTREDS